MDELFTAVKGRGAFLNRRRLSAASAKQSLASALLITEVGTKRDAATLEAMFGRITALTQRCRAVRLCGSCALDLCAVACGRADVMYEVGFGGPWDCAAGALIVQEAGGHVADVVGGPFDVMARRVLAAGSAALLHEAAGVLQACKFSALEPGPPTGQGPPAAGPS